MKNDSYDRDVLVFNCFYIFLVRSETSVFQVIDGVSYKYCPYDFCTISSSETRKRKEGSVNGTY